jgi:uncharacterized damage-inducible protein DinB
MAGLRGESGRELGKEPRDPGPDPARAFLERSRKYLRDDYLVRIRMALAKLSPADLWWRPNESSNSVGNLLLHLAGNARQWIVSGVGAQADVRRRQQEFDAREGLDAAAALAALEESVHDVDAVLARLDPATLGERRTIQGNDVTLLDAIYHVVEHFSMHTGQIIYIVKMRSGADLGFWKIGPDGSARPVWREPRGS